MYSSEASGDEIMMRIAGSSVPADHERSSSCRRLCESDRRATPAGAAAEIGAERLRGQARARAPASQCRLPRMRVELAVVREQAEGVRELPARQGVGGEARMDDRERALQPRVGQVREKAGELGRRQHPLEHHRARRTGSRTEVVARARPGGGSRTAALERVALDVARADDEPADHAARTSRAPRARRRVLDRDVAPAEHAWPRSATMRSSVASRRGAGRRRRAAGTRRRPVRPGSPISSRPSGAGRGCRRRRPSRRRRPPRRGARG